MAGQINTVTIASGGTTSSAYQLGNLALVGIACPTIDSSNLSLQVSSDGGQTYQTLVTDSTGPGTNGAYTILPANSTGNVYVALNPDWTFGVDSIKLLAGSSQSALRTFILHIRDKR